MAKLTSRSLHEFKLSENFRDLKLGLSLQSKQDSNPRKTINNEQIQLYKRLRLKGNSQAISAAIAGFCERTGSRIDSGTHRSHHKYPRNYSSCYDSYKEFWPEIENILSSNPYISICTLFKELQDRYPNKINGSIRTFQRKVKSWRQKHYPLYQAKHRVSKKECQEYFDWMNKLSQRGFRESEIINQFSKKLTPKDLSILLENLLSPKLLHRKKAITILSYLNGIPNSIIYKFLIISSRSVERYIQTFKRDGSIKLFKSLRKTKKKSEDSKYIDKIFEILHAPPSSYGINRTSWKMIDIHRLMREAGLNIALSNIRQIIRNSGYKVRSAKKVLTSTDPDYKEKLKKITEILSSLGSHEKFFSIDEYGPFSVKIQGGRMLMPPGETNIVPQYQKSKGTIILTAAIELSTNQVIHFYSDKKNTEEMIKLLNILLERYPDEECIYLSWDAASWHASQALYERVEEINSTEYKNKHKSPIVKLAPLPACAQFLNIIESIFSGMSRAIIHNSNYESVDASKNAIDLYFQERNQHFKENPKRAGNKIWGKERVIAEFNESNNCKDPRYR